MTVATSTEDDDKEVKPTITDLPVVILDPRATLNVQAQQTQIVHMNMSTQPQLSHISQSQLQQAAVQTHTQVICLYYYLTIIYFRPNFFIFHVYNL